MNKQTKLARKFKSAIAIVLCAIMSFACMACAPKSEIDENTIIVRIADLGLGTQVLEAQAERFNALKAEEGMKVVISADPGDINISENMLSEGYHIIYTGGKYTSPETAHSQGWTAEIDDVMTSANPYDTEGKTIDERVPDTMKWYFQNSEGKYMALPTQEYYGGLSYDKDLFDAKGYYFAKPGTDAEDLSNSEEFESAILGAGYKFNFTSKNECKSVGPDGKAGTEDDGLASSLYELIAQCEYMKNDGIIPFILTGQYNYYINYFADALFASLLGKENAKAIQNFKTSSLDVVTGYKEDALFAGAQADSVKAPIVETIKDVEEKHGFYTTMSVEKFFSYVFLRLMDSEKWYTSAANGSTSHTGAQADFIYGIQPQENTRQGAFLVECSYWYNESTIRENFVKYQAEYPSAPERQLRWMPLPGNIYTSVDGTDGTNTVNGVTESKKGEPIILSIASGGYMLVNSRFKDDATAMNIIKNWLQFINSDVELSKATVQACYGTMLKYDVKEADYAEAPAYVKSFMALRKSAYENDTIIYPISDSAVFKNNAADFIKGNTSGYFGTGTAHTGVVRDGLNKPNGIIACFEERMFKKDEWAAKLSGFAETAEYKTYPDGHAKTGNIEYSFLTR